jgi:uncharacterized SAM-dependent methyltransferase
VLLQTILNHCASFKCGDFDLDSWSERAQWNNERKSIRFFLGLIGDTSPLLSQEDLKVMIFIK